MRFPRMAFVLSFLLVLPAQANDIVLGTGSKSGVYFQVGRSICRLLTRNLEAFSCQPLETAGSVFNLANVEGGALEVGIVQSDIHHHAVHRTGPYQFVDTPHERLRSLFSLYVEPFNLLARNDSGIASIEDLKGKRVNVGNPGSGHHKTMETVMRAKGWHADDFQLLSELPAAQQTMALCHDNVQAMVYVAGHPNRSIAHAINLCDAALVPVSGKEIDQLVSEQPFYAYTAIPAGTYPGLDRPVQTFGVLATVVSSSDVDEALVYDLVKTVFDNLDRFRRMHMAFGDLDPNAMITRGLAAPLHPGAERYYREMGWLD